MRYGRALVAGLGWAGALGGLALCVLIFLSAFVAFDGDGPGVEPREDKVVRLRRVPDAEVPRVPLGRPSSRASGGGSGGSGGGAPLAGGGRPAQPTLGNTTREVVGAVGAEVGRVSPPAGQVIDDTGEALGDAVDALNPPPPPR